MTQEGTDEFQPERAMVVVAHPDDAEFMVAGTVAKWAGRGAEVTYVVITNGNKGSEDPEMTPTRLAEIREAEQRAAGLILGVKNFEFLGYEDGYLVHTLDLRRDITRMIRKYRPEVVVTFDPTARFMFDSYANHPDHRAAGDATVDAIFPSARDRLTFPELLSDGLEPHKVKQLWMGSGAGANANVWVDITETIDLKKKALAAHPSQLSEEVAEFASEMARGTAAAQEFEYGEAFRRIIFDQPREERLAQRREASS
ncbi:MAG: PIG-L family deacetylase [Chloroflexi bacterium]|nr:PIG-L family deacetylase [Chloroflexota bacterium]